jgi:hypothetical protein
MQRVVGRIGPDRPHVLNKYALHEFDLPLTPPTAPLGDAQRSRIVRMYDRHDTWPPQIPPRVIEDALRGFRRVAVTPARRIKRIAEVGRVDKLYPRRGLRALKPSSWNPTGRGIRFRDEIAQSPPANQLTIRLAHHRELTEVQALVGRQHPLTDAQKAARRSAPTLGGQRFHDGEG